MLERQLLDFTRLITLLEAQCGRVFERSAGVDERDFAAAGELLEAAG